MHTHILDFWYVGNVPGIEEMGVLQRELNRYVRKGWSLCTALVFAGLYFVVLPAVLEGQYEAYVGVWGSEQHVVVFGTFLLDVVVLWSLFALVSIVYRWRPASLERCKAQAFQPWPWESNPKAWSLQQRKTLVTILLNLHVLAPLSMYIDSLSGVYFRLDRASYPSTWEILTQMVFFMVVEDCSFYFLHRLLHTRSLYRLVHKQHHEYTSTIAYAALYAHPVEFVLGNMLPVGLGPKLLGSRVHIMTYWLWVVLRDGETIDGHSGYELGWSPFRLLPFSAGSQYHAFHHSQNSGNFGSFFTLWDSVLGTNEPYYRAIEAKKSH